MDYGHDVCDDSAVALRHVCHEHIIGRQNVEALEREEQSLGRAIKLVKGKVGKPKAKKMNLEETMPSPFGRRVDPPTQPLKADAAKKLTKKKKVRDDGQKLLMVDDQCGLEGCHSLLRVTLTQP